MIEKTPAEMLKEYEYVIAYSREGAQSAKNKRMKPGISRLAASDLYRRELSFENAAEQTTRKLQIYKETLALSERAWQ